MRPNRRLSNVALPTLSFTFNAVLLVIRRDLFKRGDKTRCCCRRCLGIVFTGVASQLCFFLIFAIFIAVGFIIFIIHPLNLFFTSTGIIITIYFHKTSFLSRPDADKIKHFFSLWISRHYCV